MSGPYVVPVKVEGKTVGMAKVTQAKGGNGFDIGVRLYPGGDLPEGALSLSVDHLWAPGVPWTVSDGH